MRILFDKNIPYPIRSFLTGHTVITAAEQGWSRLVNGDLLREAEEAAFDTMVTADQSLEYQQNLKGRKLALVVLSTNRLSVLEKDPAKLRAAIDAVAEGSYEFVRYELPPRKKPDHFGAT